MRSILLFSAAALAVSCAGAASAAPNAGLGAANVFAANRAATGGDAWADKGQATVTYAYSGQGLIGVVSSTYDVRTGVFDDVQNVGPSHGADGFDGAGAWMQDPSGAVTPEGGGDTRQLAVNEAYRNANLWWRPGFGGAAVTILPSQTDGGDSFDVLRVAPRGGKPFEAWFDAKTHLLARTVEAQGAQTITTWYSDYRPFDGAFVPGKQVIDDGTGVQYRQSETLKSAVFTPRRPASAYAAPQVMLTDSQILNPTGRTTVPFKLLNNHIYAEVKVNGRGPFLFIFDTGGHSVLTPDTAKALAVNAQGDAPGTGAGNGIVNVGLAKGVDFRVGDLVLQNQAIVVLPFEAPAVEGFDEQGMLGFELFRRFVTVIDYGARTLTFIDPAKFHPAGAGVAVPFVFYNSNPEVLGTFEGVPAKFNIDTGSRVELTLTKPFVEAHGLMARHLKGVLAVDGWGVGGRSTSYVTRARDVTLGPVRIDGVVTGFATDAHGAFSDPNYQGNVGSGLLKRFVVTFDYGRRIMYLKPIAKHDPDVGTFDRAGFWINTSAGGFAIVNLTSGGAAETAGLKTGDEITAIDGADAKSIPITDLRQRLRDEPAGAVIKLTVLSGGVSRSVDLTLKDQI